jgi:hypothetical protein
MGMEDLNHNKAILKIFNVIVIKDSLVHIVIIVQILVLPIQIVKMEDLVHLFTILLKFMSFCKEDNMIRMDFQRVLKDTFQKIV